MAVSPSEAAVVPDFRVQRSQRQVSPAIPMTFVSIDHGAVQPR